TCTLRANRRMRLPSRIGGGRGSSLTSSQGLCVVAPSRATSRATGAAGSWPDSAAAAKSAANMRDAPRRAPAPDGLGRLRQKTHVIQLPGLGRRAWPERIWTGTPLAVGVRSPGSSRNGVARIVAPDQRPQLVRRLGLQRQAVVPADGPELACPRDLVGV